MKYIKYFESSQVEFSWSTIISEIENIAYIASDDGYKLYINSAENDHQGNITPLQNTNKIFICFIRKYGFSPVPQDEIDKKEWFLELYDRIKDISDDYNINIHTKLISIPPNKKSIYLYLSKRIT